MNGVGTVSQKKIGLLFFLLLALIGVLYQRVVDGLLEVVMSKGMLALQMLELFVFLPLGIIVFTVRLSWFQPLHSWLFVTELN